MFWVLAKSMLSLKKYYVWFFCLCLAFTLIAGVLAALLPSAMAGIVTALPYLIAMIIVLYKFINQQQRAPSDQERKKMSLGFTLIFWGYNFLGIFLGILFFSRKDPEVWQNFLVYIQNGNFISLSLIMILMLAIPLYLITYWFYGPQAKRMANKMVVNK